MSEKGIYRIMDANFNRGREALRVMEEFCRFLLNDADLNLRAKQMRHRLCTIIRSFDSSELLCARDSDTDIGRSITFDGQMKRMDMQDTFLASSKRLGEALRVLAEMAMLTKPAQAAELEQLRFDAYSLERDILMTMSTGLKFAGVSLYVLAAADQRNSDNEVLELVRCCISGGADCIQLRAKGLSDRKLIALAGAFVRLCSDNGVLSIINDRTDIAVLAAADGVHLGTDDITVATAKRLQTVPLIFGATTHSMTELEDIAGQKPTYVSLGPVFSSHTKPWLQVAGLGYLSAGLEFLKDKGIGHVAIGGITLENIDQVLAAGATCVAVCEVVSDIRKTQQTCRQLKKRIKAARCKS